MMRVEESRIEKFLYDSEVTFADFAGSVDDCLPDPITFVCKK